MTDEFDGQEGAFIDHRRPKVGHLVRSEDESGVSGTGVVAEFIEFSDGRVVISWWNDANDNVDTDSNGLAIYDSLASAIDVHGHDGKTQFRLLPLGAD